MGFIERLRQQKEAEELVRVQREVELARKSEAEELALRQKEAQEREFHQHRRQQAETFRQESKVGLKFEEVVKFLETPNIPMYRTSSDGDSNSSWTEYIARGSRGEITNRHTDRDPIRQRDSYSVFDEVHWDRENLGSTKKWGGGYSTHHCEKYIVVETCPDGTIVFHASLSGSTTLRLAEWKNKNKDELDEFLDKALEKAYKHPGINKYSYSYPKPLRSISEIFGGLG